MSAFSNEYQLTEQEMKYRDDLLHTSPLHAVLLVGARLKTVKPMLETHPENAKLKSKLGGYLPLHYVLLRAGNGREGNFAKFDFFDF